MTTIRTFGRFPTLREMKAYYNRDDVLAFLYNACQRRNVSAALRGKRWQIMPTSEVHLREIINEIIKTQIEPICQSDSDCLAELRVGVEVVRDLENPDRPIDVPDKHLLLWHGTTEDRVSEILKNGFKTQAGARGVWFSPSFGFARRIAQERAKARGEAHVLLRCFFDVEQSKYLEGTQPNEYVFYPAILSFHANTKIEGGGFDIIFEADFGGWRRSFEALSGAIQMLDDLGVFYRLKYSGVRSLHLMIPFEAFPNAFNGEPILSQADRIYRKIRNYFQRHCGMGKVDRPKVLRLAYSLNEDNGFVSLPLNRGELPRFRPWQGNLHLVSVDKPWHSDVPPEASQRTLRFLETVYSEETARPSPIGVRQLKTGYSSPAIRHPSLVNSITFHESVEQLKSGAETIRVEAAWHLMNAPEAVPHDLLQESLADSNADVRWYLTEALQKNIDTDAVRLASKMLFDSDLFVRDSAVGVLTLAGKTGRYGMLNPFWDVAMNFVEAFSKSTIKDFMWAVQEICNAGDERAVEPFLEAGIRGLASRLQEALKGGQRLDTDLGLKLPVLTSPPAPPLRGEGRLDSPSPCRRGGRGVRSKGKWEKASLISHERLSNYLRVLDRLRAFSEVRKSLIPRILHNLAAENPHPDYVLIVRDPIGALCNHLVSQSEINPNTVTVARAIADTDWYRLEKLPGRIPADSLQTWFEKVWVVCGSALCFHGWRGHNPIAVFHNAYRHLKRYGTHDAERLEKIRQLELLFRLNNQEAPNVMDEASLFQAADELTQSGHALRGVVMGMVSDSSTPAVNGAIRLLSHLQWEDSPELLIQQFARSNSLRKAALKSLVELGEAAVQPLIEAIRASPHQRTIVLSINALGQIGDKRAIPVLKEYVAHPNKHIRFGAIRALKYASEIVCMRKIRRLEPHQT